MQVTGCKVAGCNVSGYKDVRCKGTGCKDAGTGCMGGGYRVLGARGRGRDRINLRHTKIYINYLILLTGVIGSLHLE